MQAQGLELKTYLQYTGMNMEKFREGFKERAEKQVKLDLAIEQIVAAEKIEASDEDVDAEYQKLADAYQMDAEAIKKSIPAEHLKSEIVSRKAVDLIVANAVITEEKPAAKKTAAKKAPVKKEDKAAGEKKPAAKKPTAKKAAEKTPKAADAEKKEAADAE